MDAQTLLIAVRLLEMVAEKGIPAFIKWQDGTEIDQPTLEDFENLKVKKMSEK